MQRKKSKPDPVILEKIAEAAIEHRWDIVRTTLVKAVAGRSFYHRFCLGKQNMLTLLGQIRQLNPERYSHLKYIPFERGPRTFQFLKPREEEIIIKLLLDDCEKWRGENPSRSIIRKITKKLEGKGFSRTEGSVVYHAYKIWKGEYPDYNGVMPTRLASLREKKTTTILRRGIDRKVKELKDSHRQDLEGIIERDVKGKKRKEYLALCSRGHQELIAYLIDPKNYENYLGKGLELVAVDFTKSNTPQDLYEHYKQKVSELEETCKEYQEIVAFVDNWLRCDMIFKNKNGVYFVVEIKQNAINHVKNGQKGYPNADKVVEQLGAYLGGLQRRIQWKNKHLPENDKIPENVYGILTAYCISDDLQEFLNQKDGLRAVTIPREGVIKAVRIPKPKKSRRTSEILLKILSPTKEENNPEPEKNTKSEYVS